jgi:hypothetical protein
MKQFLRVLFVTLAMIVSTAMAWSSLEPLESAVESMQHCYSMVAGSDSDQEDSDDDEEEEDEEPDCD